MQKKQVVKRKKYTGLTELVVVLDKSGSMYSTRSDTIGGFNTLLEEQRKLGKNIKVSLVLFNERYDLVYNGCDIANVSKFSDASYVPAGSTALLDAIGRTIDSVNTRIDATPKKQQPKKVIMAIITDGLENCSTDFTKKQIKEKIEQQKSKKSWEFVFIGANQDAFDEGGRLGVVSASTCNYTANSVGTQAAYCALSAHTRSFRSGGTGVNMSEAYDIAKNKVKKV